MRRADTLALGRTTAGAHSLRACGIPRGIRLTTYYRGAEIAWHSGQPGPGQALDEGERYSRQAQAALQSDDRQQACAAGGAEPAGPAVRDERAGSDLDGGHHVHSHAGRLAVSGGGDGLVHAHDRGLVNGWPDDTGTGHECAAHGAFATQTGIGRAASFGSRQPVLQSRLPGAAGRIRHGGEHEPQGKLLGQRADGKLLQQLEERTRLP